MGPITNHPQSFKNQMVHRLFESVQFFFNLCHYHYVHCCSIIRYGLFTQVPTNSKIQTKKVFTQEMNSQEPAVGNSEWNLTHREDIPCHNQLQIRSHQLPQESGSSDPHQTKKLVCSLFQ